MSRADWAKVWCLIGISGFCIWVLVFFAAGFAPALDEPASLDLPEEIRLGVFLGTAVLVLCTFAVAGILTILCLVDRIRAVRPGRR